MSQGNLHPPLTIPYSISCLSKPFTAPSIALSSSNSILIWSDASSQSSDGSSVNSDSFDPPLSPHLQAAENSMTCDLILPTPTCETSLKFPTNSIPRKRVSCLLSSSNQYDQRTNFVDSLVDSSAQIVEAIWPRSSVSCRFEMCGKEVLPLRTFIQETLRRSRTSYSTLQVTLYYLILVKPHVLGLNSSIVRGNSNPYRALQCGRRMFLAALILASKYLQDRNYSARAWSKISGLNVLEINQNEISFLIAVNWQLHITNTIFQRWTNIVLKYTSISPSLMGTMECKSGDNSHDLKSIILHLNPQLDNIHSINPIIQINRVANPAHTPQISFNYSSSASSSEISNSTSNTCSPCILEPSHSSSCTTTRPVPALGLLPTPKLTSNEIKFSVSRATPTICKNSSSFAKFSSNVPSPQTNRKLKTLHDGSIQVFNSDRSDFTKSLSSSSISGKSLPRDESQSSGFPWIRSTLGITRDCSIRGVNSRTWLQNTKNRSSEHLRASKSVVQDTAIDQRSTISCESPNRLMSLCFGAPSLPPLQPPMSHKPEKLYLDERNATRALQGLHSHPRCSDYQPFIAKGNEDQIFNANFQGVEITGPFTGQCWQPLLRKRPSSNFEYPTATRFLNDNPDLQFIADPITFGASTARKRVCCATEASLSIPQSSLHSVFGALDSFGM